MARLTHSQQRVLDMADANHIWLSAFGCINPSAEFCEGLGRQVLQMLTQDDNLIPVRGEVGDRMSELTPTLYLRVSKS